MYISNFLTAVTLRAPSPPTAPKETAIILEEEGDALDVRHNVYCFSYSEFLNLFFQILNIL